MKMFCNVYDKGDKYKVIDAFTLSSNVHINFTIGTNVLEINDTKVFDAIVYNLEKKNIVYIPKNIEPLGPGDLIVDILDPLKEKKVLAITRVTNIINNRLSNITFYNYYKIIILNNKLADKGFLITGDKKEDAYLDILNSGDEELINMLQEFLELQSKISEHENVYSHSIEVIESINEATDINEIDNILSNFLSLIE